LAGKEYLQNWWVCGVPYEWGTWEGERFFFLEKRTRLDEPVTPAKTRKQNFG